MKWLLVLFALGTLAVRNVYSANPATKAEILAFTGVRTKFVWTRWPWCDDNYQPNTSRRDQRTSTKLCVYDTDQDQVRYIDDEFGSHVWARISRSGNWVVWNDYVNKCVWIRDFNGTTAKKKFMPQGGGTATFAGAWWYDAVSKKEYVYCLSFTDGGGGTNQVFKIGVKSDGSADVADITTITLPGTSKLDMAISVSQNGAKIGCAYPWPNTYIYDIASRSLAGRHLGVFGCQANLAPDNSYRFFHCNDEHTHLNMWGADMSTTMWAVDLSKNLPGLPVGAETDFDSPRWSNNVQYFSNTFPLQLSYQDPPDDSGEEFMWRQSASWVQNTAKRHWISSFVLGKFTVDYKAIEKYVMVASDPRYFEFGNDTWIASGIVAGATSALPSHPNRSSVAPASEGTVLKVTDLQGRLLGRGIETMQGRASRPGLRVVSATHGQERETARRYIAR